MTLEDLETIKPTVFKENAVYEPQWLDDTVQVLDLGGQVSFLQNHLDKKNFEHRELIIFVVDVQNMAQIEQAKEYFTHIVTILKTLQTLPIVLVLLHKVDPALKNTLDQNIQQYTMICTEVLKDFKPNIFLTSIYDNSIYEALLSMIMKAAHILVINFSLRLVDTSTWSIHDKTTAQETEEYLNQLGRKQGSEVRKKWIEMMILQKQLDVLPGNLICSVDTLNDKQIQLEIDIDDISLSSMTYSSAKCLEIYLKEFFDALYFKTTAIESTNEKLTLIIESYV